MRHLLVACPFLVLVGGGDVRAECDEKFETTAGVPDEFMLPSEAPDPSDELFEYTELYWIGQGNHREFDEVDTDVALIHTFTGWGETVCGAWLELRVRGGPSPLSDNDSFRLELVGGEDPGKAFHYWATFRNALGAWGPGYEATLEVDLADLPPHLDYPTNILDVLQDGDLDLLVEDDTAIDYAELEVCLCGTVSVEGESWGRTKARYRR